MLSLIFVNPYLCLSLLACDGGKEGSGVWSSEPRDQHWALFSSLLPSSVAAGKQLE